MKFAGAHGFTRSRVPLIAMLALAAIGVAGCSGDEQQERSHRPDRPAFKDRPAQRDRRVRPARRPPVDAIASDAARVLHHLPRRAGVGPPGRLQGLPRRQNEEPVQALDRRCHRRPAGRQQHADRGGRVHAQLRVQADKEWPAVQRRHGQLEHGLARGAAAEAVHSSRRTSKATSIRSRGQRITRRRSARSRSSVTASTPRPEPAPSGTRRRRLAGRPTATWPRACWKPKA